MIFFKVLIEMIFHFVLMVIIMVAGVSGVNGFDLSAVGQMDYCQLWVKQFFWGDFVGGLSFPGGQQFHNKYSFLI